MILITGANGFLGSYISKRLKEDGHSVLNYGRDKLDVLNKLSVERVILDNDIKCVFIRQSRVVEEPEKIQRRIFITIFLCLKIL